MAKVVSLVQFGLGSVGRALLKQVLEARPFHERQLGLQLSYVALCDSRGQVIETQGLPDGELRAVLEVKAAEGSLAGYPAGTQGSGGVSLIEAVATRGIERAIVLDLTASRDMGETLERAREAGYGLVLANKIPLAGPWKDFCALTEGDRTLYEATVGAGLPILRTLKGLLESGDAVHRVRGCFSGTLGYLCSRLEEGEPFSAAVWEARSQGYTEPDPRVDLAGTDVARKALILARVLGYPMELDQVEVESLFPAEMEALSLQEFMEALPSLDGDFHRQVEEAAEKGQVLRYVARVEEGSCRVGTERVPREGQLGSLKGPDNIVIFQTERYNERPLVIIGPGAGPKVTAAGVLNDILELARTG